MNGCFFINGPQDKNKYGATFEMVDPSATASLLNPKGQRQTSKQRSIKTPTANYQEQRRLAALDQQQNARRHALQMARTKAMDAACQAVQSGYIDALPSHAPTTDASPSANDPAAACRFWASLFMMPEWLIELPSDLGPSWYVSPRPEGQRCLVLATHGRTACRLRSGRIADTFTSYLPGGGPHSRGGYCILDCIFHAPDNTFYVVDVLTWRGVDLSECSTEFRLYWLAAKLAELAAEHAAHSDTPGTGAVPASGDRRFLPLPHYPASPEGLHAAYASPQAFTRDGLYLIHSHARYWPGHTPLALLWKDAATSRYFLETDADGVPLSEQQVVLRYRGSDGAVCTGDDPPAALGMLPREFVKGVGSALSDGRLLRFKLGPGGVSFVNGLTTGADLEYVGPANQRRGRADTLSKIVFQYLARTEPFEFSALVAAAGSGGGAMDAEETVT